jgi:hypothetical protein
LYHGIELVTSIISFLNITDQGIIVIFETCCLYATSQTYHLDGRRKKLHHQGILVKYQHKSSSCRRRKAHHLVLVKSKYKSGTCTRRKPHHQGVLLKHQYKREGHPTSKEFW